MSALDAANWRRTVGDLRRALEADKVSETGQSKSNVGTPFGQAITPTTTPAPAAVVQPTVDPGFTAVAYKNLDATTKEVIAANAASNNMKPQQYY